MITSRYPDRTLVSPATAGINIPWMDEFMAECELLGCRIDYLATHDYSKDRNATKTINVRCQFNFDICSRYLFNHVPEVARIQRALWRPEDLVHRICSQKCKLEEDGG